MSAARLSRRLLLLFGLPVVLVAIWWFASAGSTSFYFPPLSRIFETFGRVWLSDRFFDDVLPSLGRLAAGYLLATVIGVAVGIPIGLSQTLRNMFEPALEFLRAIPSPVLVPIFILFAGIGTSMKVLVIISGCVWPVLLNTVEGVRSRDEVLEDVVRCYRIGPLARLWRFVLPWASPQIFAGMRQALSIGIILMVISEMFAASNGIGFAVVQFQRGFALPEMWSGIILLGLIGFLLAVLFGLIENRVLGWYFGLRRSQRGGA
jgi:ABC-type nitrate/sulfonate/bicarbonate transport system permease component